MILFSCHSEHSTFSSQIISIVKIYISVVEIKNFINATKIFYKTMNLKFKSFRSEIYLN